MRHKISSRCIAFNFTSHAMRRRNGWERLYRNRPWRSQLPFVFRPDLDLADDEASQCSNAHKALRTLPALLNIKDTACKNRDRFPNPLPGVSWGPCDSDDLHHPADWKALPLHQDGPDVCWAKAGGNRSSREVKNLACLWSLSRVQFVHIGEFIKCCLPVVEIVWQI